ncbi:MAG TPA: PTS fructose transporter subunit IIA [Gammaproteobacteria bacterium]|nr:PTS fructose transporter subunit IIA [Gammaproteobacteria bacterium]
MSVGLLVVTHNRIGHEFMRTASNILGLCPLTAECLAIEPDSDPGQVQRRGEAILRRLDQGDGVLILTDAFGSTPSNVAMRLGEDIGTAVVSGINLPMLLRVLNYPGLSLHDMQEKALSGGRDGVLLVESSSGQQQRRGSLGP